LKKSIVLLITLALIIAIAALIAVGLHVVDNTTKEVDKKQTFIQTKIFIDNITRILQEKRGDINSTDGLNLLFSLPIDLQTSNISAHIEFESAAKGLNPNNFIKKEQKKIVIDPDYVLLFDRILQVANVADPDLFIAMIEDTLDKDLAERIPGSEIALYDKRFAQGSIENYNKFKVIVDRYVRITKDPNIYKIPWRDILSFYSKKIDFNHISPELLRYMLPSLDEESIKRVTKNKKEVFTNWKDVDLPNAYKKELQRFAIGFYVPIVQGRLSIKYGTSRGFATFIYDIQKQRILAVEYKIF